MFYERRQHSQRTVLNASEAAAASRTECTTAWENNRRGDARNPEHHLSRTWEHASDGADGATEVKKPILRPLFISALAIPVSPRTRSEKFRAWLEKWLPVRFGPRTCDYALGNPRSRQERRVTARRSSVVFFRDVSGRHQIKEECSDSLCGCHALFAAERAKSERKA
jgi:hypothetical protein